MAVKKLKIRSTTTLFGTDVNFVSSDGVVKISAGTNLSFDPITKLADSMQHGYLFRSPRLDPSKLAEIWNTVEHFGGPAALTVEYDPDEEIGTAWMRIVEKSDATMFAFAHSLFEKWSDEKEAEAREKTKQTALNGTLNADGTVRVTMEVTTLGD